MEAQPSGLDQYVRFATMRVQAVDMTMKQCGTGANGYEQSGKWVKMLGTTAVCIGTGLLVASGVGLVAAAIGGGIALQLTSGAGDVLTEYGKQKRAFDFHTALASNMKTLETHVT